MEIYLVKNTINEKLYVGQSIKSDPLYYGSGLLINRSLNKYGIENFKKEILEVCASKEELNDREKYWIEFYNTICPNGYNIARGAVGGDNFTNHPEKEKIREQMSKRLAGEGNPMFGKNHSPESKRQISLNKKGQRAGIPTWNKGKKLSVEEIERQKTLKLQRGTNKGNSLSWLLIDPSGIEHRFQGSLEKFCAEHNISCSSCRFYDGKGIVPPPKGGKTGPLRENLTGWNITHLGRIQQK